MIAVDASVAAKWYLPEEGSPQALALLQHPDQLIAPSLIRLEVCAAMTRRVRNQEITSEESQEHCREWLADLRDDAVHLVPEDEILERAIDLSIRIRHSLQDCLYLAVAALHGVPLITADRRFHERAIECYPAIQLLNRWQIN